MTTNAAISTRSAPAPATNSSPNRRRISGSAATSTNANIGSETIARYSIAGCSSTRVRAGSAPERTGNSVVNTAVGTNAIVVRTRYIAPEMPRSAHADRREPADHERLHRHHQHHRAGEGHGHGQQPAGEDRHGQRRPCPEDAVEREHGHAEVVTDAKLEDHAEAAERRRHEEQREHDGRGPHGRVRGHREADREERERDRDREQGPERHERPEQLRLPRVVHGGLPDDHPVDPELSEVAEQVAQREQRAPLAVVVLAERSHHDHRDHNSKREVNHSADELDGDIEVQAAPADFTDTHDQYLFGGTVAPRRSNTQDLLSMWRVCTRTRLTR